MAVECDAANQLAQPARHHRTPLCHHCRLAVECNAIGRHACQCTPLSKRRLVVVRTAIRSTCTAPRRPSPQTCCTPPSTGRRTQRHRSARTAPRRPSPQTCCTSFAAGRQLRRRQPTRPTRALIRAVVPPPVPSSNPSPGLVAKRTDVATTTTAQRATPTRSTRTHAKDTRTRR